MAACNNTESERRPLFSIWTLYQQRAPEREREEHFLLSLSLSLLLAADPARGKSNNTKVRKRKSATAFIKKAAVQKAG
jgi:hypothetical protein